MENNHPVIADKEDLKTNKASTSRFLFLLGFFGIFIFAWSACFNLYEHRYKPADVKINESSLYNPKYK